MDRTGGCIQLKLEALALGIEALGLVAAMCSIGRGCRCSHVGAGSVPSTCGTWESRWQRTNSSADALVVVMTKPRQANTSARRIRVLSVTVTTRAACRLKLTEALRPMGASGRLLPPTISTNELCCRHRTLKSAPTSDVPGEAATTRNRIHPQERCILAYD